MNIEGIMIRRPRGPETTTNDSALETAEYPEVLAEAQIHSDQVALQQVVISQLFFARIDSKGLGPQTNLETESQKAIFSPKRNVLDGIPEVGPLSGVLQETPILVGYVVLIGTQPWRFLGAQFLLHSRQDEEQE